MYSVPVHEANINEISLCVDIDGPVAFLILFPIDMENPYRLSKRTLSISEPLKLVIIVSQIYATAVLQY